MKQVKHSIASLVRIYKSIPPSWGHFVNGSWFVLFEGSDPCEHNVYIKFLEYSQKKHIQHSLNVVKIPCLASSDEDAMEICDGTKWADFGWNEFYRAAMKQFGEVEDEMLRIKLQQPNQTDITELKFYFFVRFGNCYVINPPATNIKLKQLRSECSEKKDNTGVFFSSSP